MFIPTEDGRWVNDGFARLAEVVQDYDHNLELRWIPPELRTREDRKPYCVWDKLSNTPVLFANELDTPDSILARLLGADSLHGSIIDKLDANNSAATIMRAKERADLMEEAADEAEFLMRSPLNMVRHKGMKLDENRRRMD